MKLLKPNFTKTKLLPAVIQDIHTGNALMVGFMNQKAYQQTLITKRITFWSRSRNKLWQKGETSGNYLILKRVLLDCDRDTILCLVKPTGPTCHTGNYSCFQPQPHQFLNTSILVEISNVLKNRLQTRPKNSYSASLFNKGTSAIAAKITEEASEVIKAATQETTKRLVEEIADLWFHALVLMVQKKISLKDIYSELTSRRQRVVESKEDAMIKTMKSKPQTIKGSPRKLQTLRGFRDFLLLLNNHVEN